MCVADEEAVRLNQSRMKAVPLLDGTWSWEQCIRYAVRRIPVLLAFVAPTNPLRRTLVNPASPCRPSKSRWTTWDSVS